jgi:hypothetical protein
MSRTDPKAFLVDSPDAKALFEGAYAPLGSLSGKTKVAYLLGLITNGEAIRADAARKVRNIFAHEISASFSHPDVQKLCRKAPIYEGVLIDRDAFLHMAINTVVHLNYRDLRVAATQKRQPLTAANRDRLDCGSNGS